MKKNRLLYIGLSVLVSPIVILALAAADIMVARKDVMTLAKLYVEHSTEKMTGYVNSEGIFTQEGEKRFPDASDKSARVFPPFPARFPTYFAVYSNGGEFLYGSGILRDAIQNNISAIPAGDAYEVAGAGERFIVARCTADGGKFFVTGGVAWKDIRGNASSIFLWPVLIALSAIWSALVLWALIRRVIRPITNLELAVSKLKWGSETLDVPMTSMNEQIRNIHNTLEQVSRDVYRTMKANRTYVNDLVNVQEGERTNISRDIHDGPLQDVTALIQRLRLARSPENTEEETKMELDLAEKIAFTTVKEMRALCDFLNPPWLELGLSQALTELTERQSLQYGVKINLGIDEEIETSDDETLAFFRVVQEAVTNSVQHGEARNIWIDLKCTPDGIELTIQDDGYGFELKEDGAADLYAEGHRGLTNMEERMALVGGRLKIISYLGEGTCIRCLLP